MKKLLSLFFAFMAINLLSQVTNLSNGPGFITDYVGWDAIQPFPLRVEHQGNFPIDFATNNPLGWAAPAPQYIDSP